MGIVLSALLLLAQAAKPATEIRLVLKTGDSYTLAAPSTHKDGRVSFKTTDGKFFSVKESDVASEATVAVPQPKKHPSPLDTKQLGAIAREQREETGKSAAVAAPAAAKKPKTKKKESAEPSASSTEPPPDTHDHPIPRL